MSDPGEAHPTVGLYVGVFVALLALTALTVWVAYLDLRAWNPVAALLIAGTKATLVGLYFMHLKFEEPLIRLFAGASVLFLTLLVGFTAADVLFRVG